MVGGRDRATLRPALLVIGSPACLVIGELEEEEQRRAKCCEVDSGLWLMRDSKAVQVKLSLWQVEVVYKDLWLLGLVCCVVTLSMTSEVIM